MGGRPSSVCLGAASPLRNPPSAKDWKQGLLLSLLLPPMGSKGQGSSFDGYPSLIA